MLFINKWLFNEIKLSFQSRDNTDIRKCLRSIIFWKVDECLNGWRMWQPIKKLLKNSANDFVWFNTAWYRDSKDFSTQSFLFLDWLELFRYEENPVSYFRAILFVYFSSKRARNYQVARRVKAPKWSPNFNFLLSCEYHRDHIFRSTIARQAASSYLIIRRVASTNLFIWFDIRINLSLF